MTQPVSPDKPASEALKACPVCTRPERPRIYVTNAICSCTYCGWRAEIQQLGNTLTPPPSALDDEVVAVLTECADDLEAEVRNRWGDDARLSHMLERDLSPVVKARDLLTRLKDRSK